MSHIDENEDILPRSWCREQGSGGKKRQRSEVGIIVAMAGQVPVGALKMSGQSGSVAAATWFSFLETCACAMHPPFHGAVTPRNDVPGEIVGYQVAKCTILPLSGTTPTPPPA